jgi:hypothetical protein
MPETTMTLPIAGRSKTIGPSITLIICVVRSSKVRQQVQTYQRNCPKQNMLPRGLVSRWVKPVKTQQKHMIPGIASKLLAIRSLESLPHVGIPNIAD